MKKFSLVLALALVIGSVAVSSCSSKETRMDEAAMSPSTDTAVAENTAVESANLGSSSSGQGR